MNRTAQDHLEMFVAQLYCLLDEWDQDARHHEVHCRHRDELLAAVQQVMRSGAIRNPGEIAKYGDIGERP